MNEIPPKITDDDVRRTIPARGKVTARCLDSRKLSLVGKDLDEYSLETVKMFCRDATAARFSIATSPLKAAS